MKEKNLYSIEKLFDGKEIRSVWDASDEKYYFSIVDVIYVLTNSDRPRKYWNDLKVKLKNEGSELSEKIGQLKIKSNRDNKYYLTDVLDIEGILRLIESVPSPKAEPFKLWLASLGKKRIDEMFDPSISIQRAINMYRRKGRDENWINKRIKGIKDRNELTDVWKDSGIKEPIEFALLTDEIYESWSGMNTKEYKKYKNLRKESLRDNMSPIEIILTDLSEESTKMLTKKKKPKGLKNLKVCRDTSNIAYITRNNLNELLDDDVVTKNNNLNYKYVDDLYYLGCEDDE